MPGEPVDTQSYGFPTGNNRPELDTVGCHWNHVIYFYIISPITFGIQRQVENLRRGGGRSGLIYILPDSQQRV
jgi:hypothetical protein